MAAPALVVAAPSLVGGAGGVVFPAVVTGSWAAPVVLGAAPSALLPQAAAAATRGRASNGSTRRVKRFIMFLHMRAGARPPWPAALRTRWPTLSGCGHGAAVGPTWSPRPPHEA